MKNVLINDLILVFGIEFESKFVIIAVIDEREGWF